MTTGREGDIVRDQTGQPGIHLVQVGWDVNDQGGDLVGEVIERDADSMVVKLAGGADDRVRLPTRLIGEEDETAKRATLAVDSSELDSLVPLDDDPAPGLT